MRAGHWFGVAITLAIVVAGFIASGSDNPAIWPLAGMAAGSVLIGGRTVTSQRSSKAGAPDARATQHPWDAGDRDIHDFASTIVEGERPPSDSP